MPSLLVKRIIRTFSTQVGCQIIGIVTGVVVARLIGPAGKGFASYAITAVNLVSVFFFGFSDSVFYQFGKQQHPARAVHAAMLRVIFVALSILIPVFVVTAVVVPSQRPLAAAAAVLPFALYVQLSTPFLLVRDQILLTNIRALTQSFGTALLTIPLLLLAHQGLGAVIGVWIFFYVVMAVQSAWGVRPILASSPPADEAPRELAAEQVRFGLRAAGASVAGYCNVRVNVVIISIMLSTSALGWYTLAIASGEMLWQVSRALLWPALSRIGSDPQPQSAQLVARLTRNTLTIVGGLGVIAFAIGPWLIVHVYGEAFAPAGDALRWALPGLVTYAAEAALTQFIMLQLVRPFTLIWIQGASTVLCASITIATIHQFGIVAAAASTSFTYLLVTFALTAVFMRSTGIPFTRIVFIQRDDLCHYVAALKGMLHTLRLRSA
jgi:O-antigen/teichoic acid export membrane protein